MIVFASGCFDLLHVAHLHLLQFAKSHGTRLIVGLNSDSSIRRLKGPSRPIIPQDQRREMLLAIRYVDEVEIFDEDTPCELIQRIKPGVIVKGADWVGRHMPEKEVIEQLGGRLLFYHDGSDLSTTSLIERITS
jgi:D-beta-D-heptose 7-phosphate kinase/D-beta-D-heptose 1-phosphate adenosyltransferase